MSMKTTALLISACLLLTACERPNGDPESVAKVQLGGPKTATGDVQEIQTIITGIPSGDIVVEKHGREVSLAYGAVEGVSGTAANGVASAHYLEDGNTVIGAQINIAVAEDGFFYEAWLADGDTPLISLGHLRNSMNDTRHSVRFESSDNLKNYSKIIITREADDGDPTPSTFVAIAILKPTSR